jgi:tetratricopeptide (TPR) repeat protein
MNSEKITIEPENLAALAVYYSLFLLIAYIVLGAAPAAFVLIIGLGYGLYWLVGHRRNQAGSSDSESGDTITSGADTNGEAPKSEKNSTSAVKDNQTAAETAIEAAVTAKSNGNLAEAADKYNEALTEYQSALSSLPVDDTAKRAEIEQEIETTREELGTVQARQEQLNEAIEALQAAERNIQEAIVAYVEDNQTIARIRFRQARDALGGAMDTIAKTENNLFFSPIEVSVEPDRELSSTILSELPTISEAAANKLADAGIDIVDDLIAGDESPWVPPTVAELTDSESIENEEITVLTVLSWWHDDNNYAFETVEALGRRQQQADYGFNQTT